MGIYGIAPGIPPKSTFCTISYNIMEESKWYIAGEHERDPSAASTQSKGKYWHSLQCGTMNRVPITISLDMDGRLAPLRPRPGKGQGMLPGFNSNEGTARPVCHRQPAHRSKGKHKTAARIDIASYAGPRIAVLTKRPVMSDRRRRGV